VKASFITTVGPSCVVPSFNVLNIKQGVLVDRLTPTEYVNVMLYVPNALNFILLASASLLVVFNNCTLLASVPCGAPNCML
jgi:hypothetical protein